ncbi:septin-2-like, partial [Lampetra planeri]
GPAGGGVGAGGVGVGALLRSEVTAGPPHQRSEVGAGPLRSEVAAADRAKASPVSGESASSSAGSGYVGFANLPNQVHRKSVKKGFEFTLMVAGESGLGKSTLINSLFLTDLYPERSIPSAAEKISRTVEIEASTVEIEERGVKLRLTVVDTPGFGDPINSADW